MYKSIPNRSLYAIFFGIVAVLLPFTVVAASKPVGYWKFDDSISDLVTDDSSANNNDGTIVGGVTQKEVTDCVQDRCLEFNGTSGKVSIPDSSVLDFGINSFSLSVWVKFGTISGNRTVLSKESDDSTKGYALFNDSNMPGKPRIRILDIENTSDQTLGSTLDKQIGDNKWHHIVIIVDRSKKEMTGYIDGKIQNWYTVGPVFSLPATPRSIDTATPFEVGKSASSHIGFWQGFIDEVKLFNTALTQADVTALYQEGATGVGASCSSNTDCTDKPGGSKDLECRSASQGKKCVPTPANRKIGTWCGAVEHCNTQEGILKLMCNSEKNMCVGASSGISCAEEEVNTDPLLGKINQDIEPADRCDRNSLFCNTNFICQADLGAASASQIAGVGRGTEDIRDTIRNIINIALGFLGVIGVLLVLYGGWIWMTAMGEEEKVEKAKKTIIAGVVGMAIIAVAWTIVSFVLSAAQNVSGG